MKHATFAASAPCGTTGPADQASQRYAQVLKSTSVIGASSVLTIATGVVRMKAAAILLGPSGIGLLGLYSSIVEVAQSIAGLGVQSSGVRLIADAVGSGDSIRVARAAATIRRVALALGVIGCVLLVALAGPISRLTFGGLEQTLGVAFLGAVVLLREVSGGQLALIQGTRRIRELAQLQVLTVAAGTVVTVVLIYLLRERGIVPSMIAAAAISVGASTWYVRRLPCERTSLTLAQLRHQTAELLQLGVVFMSSAFLTMGAAYAIRILVLRLESVEAAGLYQAAWVLGGLYVGFILQAMGTDFYPRLTAAVRDHEECNRLVNEQAQISLLLAGPGIIATLALAPLVLSVFYSSEFQAAVWLLRWICLGMMLRVVAWPLGFVIVAKGARQILFWTELAAAAIHVGLAWLLVVGVGLTGAGMAFCILYVWHSCLVFMIAKRLTGFRWSRANVELCRVLLPLCGAVFAGLYWLPTWAGAGTGMAIAAGTAGYAVRHLVRVLPDSSVPLGLRSLLIRLRIADPPAPAPWSAA